MAFERTYPPTETWLVERADVASFAASIGAPAGDEAPATYAIRVARPTWDLLFADPELGLTLERTVHAEQTFEFARPIRVGDELRATLTLESIRRRGDTAHVKVAVAIATTAGEPVCTGRSTFLTQGVA